ncbi:MAG: anthranilate synthase component I [Candidatus Aminicenantia bacterium]
MKVERLKGMVIGWEDIPLDIYTPVSAFLKLKRNGAMFLLESVEKGERMGRYSFIGFEPEEKIFFKDNHLKIGKKRILLKRENAKSVFDAIFKRFDGEELNETVFTGGWIGYIGYEFVRFLEEIDFRGKEKSQFPELLLYKANKLIVFDHAKNSGKIIISSENMRDRDIEDAIFSIKNALFSKPIIGETSKRKIGKVSSLTPSISEDDFLEKVQRTKEYIKNGDIFQAVISIRFDGETSSDPFEIYRALRILNPSPYMFYLDFQDFQLIGSSPESHVKVLKDFISIRPIAGTRRRGKTKEEDSALERELITNEKEKAEHVMLIDLARNDIGKISVPGSVRVKENMAIEKYSHVMHIVSQVDGKLSEGKTFFDILQATFPAGTVTGAPKLRAMEIIDEMEPAERGPYAGVVGYVGFNGNIDLCIGIRMIIFRKGKFSLQAGAGIVDGSIPSNEYKEIKNKIKGMQEAIIMAEEGRFL